MLGFTPISFISTALGIIWVAVLSLIMWRRAEAAAPQAEVEAVAPPPAPATV